MRLPILILTCAMFSPFAQAADNDLQVLREQVDAMREALHDLDRRVQSLENERAGAREAPQGAANQPAPPAPVKNTDMPSPPGSIAALRMSWASIERGITKEQTLEALGPASQELTINGKLVWYYVYPGIGRGSIFFNSDGRVSSSQPPNTGW